MRPLSEIPAVHLLLFKMRSSEELHQCHPEAYRKCRTSGPSPTYKFGICHLARSEGDLMVINIQKDMAKSLGIRIRITKIVTLIIREAWRILSYCINIWGSWDSCVLLLLHDLPCRTTLLWLQVYHYSKDITHNRWVHGEFHFPKESSSHIF